MEEKCILITGGCGYIGSHMVNRFKNDYRVLVIDDLSTGSARNQFSDVTYFIGDVGDQQLLQKVFTDYAIETVIHLAAKSSVEESMKYPERYYVENVDKTLLLMKTSIAHSVKHFVFSSSASVYGQSTSTLLSEAAHLAPCSVYGESKLQAEKGLRALAANTSTNLFVFRFFNIAGNQAESFFGNFQKKPSTLIQKTARQVMAGDYDVPVYGDDYDTPDGTCVRDYVHVEDIVHAHVLLVAALRDGKSLSNIYNIGYGRGKTVLEIIDLFDEYLSAHLRKKRCPRRAGDLPISIACSEKIQNELSWQSLFKAPYHQIIESELAWAKKLIDLDGVHKESKA